MKDWASTRKPYVILRMLLILIPKMPMLTSTEDVAMTALESLILP